MKGITAKLTDGTQVFLKFHHQKHQNVRTTKVEILLLKEDGRLDRLISFGKSSFLPYMFIKERARKMALKDALRHWSIGKDDRFKIWTAYFTRDKAVKNPILPPISIPPILPVPSVKKGRFIVWPAERSAMVH